MLLAFAAAIVWLFATESGLHWALEQARKRSGGQLEIIGARGTLTSVIGIERLRYLADGTRIEARDVCAHAHLAAALGGRLLIDPLRIAELEIEIREGGERAVSPPPLPFGVHLGNVEIERLRVLRAERVYSLRKLRFAHAALGSLPPSVSAEGRFDLEHERFPMSATLTLGGTLERLETHLGLRQGDIAADIRALLAPFRPQHLVTLEARASPIDLARFSDELPHAALALVLSAKGSDSGLEGTLALTNSAAGPLDQDKLPVASVTARATSKDLENAELQELRIVLAGGGLLEGRGELSPQGFSGTLKASRLNLRALRTTLRETQLSGPLEVSIAREVQTARGTLSQEGMTVSAEAARRGDTIEVKSLRAAAQGGEVSGTATLRLADPLAFTAKLALSRFDPSAFGDYPDGSISGLVTADGHLGDAPRVDLGWSLTNSTLLDQPLETRGSARVAGRRVLQADAEATLGTSRASAHGGFGGAGDRLAWTLDVPSIGDYVDEVDGRVFVPERLLAAARRGVKDFRLRIVPSVKRRSPADRQP